jgi:GT2 family glycosyltransferase
MTEPASPDSFAAGASIIAGIADSKPPVDSEIALLIPTLGRDLLFDCLRSVLEGSRWPGQIVVVDQGRREVIGTWLAQIRSLGIDTLHLQSRERGRSRALNRGLEQTGARFVLITDDDCRVDASWVETMRAYLLEYPDRIFTGRIEAGGDGPVVAKVIEEDACVATRPGLIYDRVSGGNLGVAVDVFRRVGLFDEDPLIAFSEDGEWAYRALKAGVSVAYIPDAVVTHLGWRDENQRSSQYANYARSHAAFFGKRIRRFDAFIVLRALIHLLRSARRWVRGRATGDTEQATYAAAYLRQFVPGIVAGLQSTERPPSLSSSAPSEGRAE